MFLEYYELLIYENVIFLFLSSFFLEYTVDVEIDNLKPKIFLEYYDLWIDESILCGDRARVLYSILIALVW